MVDKYVNGQYIAMTEAEIATMQQQDRLFEEAMLKERRATLEELFSEREDDHADFAYT